MVTLPDLSHRMKDKVAKKDIKKEDAVKKEDKKELEKKELATQPVLQPVTIKLSVLEKATGNFMDAKINMRKVSDNVIVPVERVGLGKYQMMVNNENPTDYLISAERQGYIFKNSRMTIPASSTDEKEIFRKFELEHFEVGAHDVLRNIYFNFNKATFTKESYNELNKLERMLFENPGFRVKIEGHTDNIGASEYNLDLSKFRAKAVVDYLTKKGIDARRLEYEGFGENKPLATNDDEKEGREINRRVEFTVVSRSIIQ